MELVVIGEYVGYLAAAFAVIAGLYKLTLWIKSIATKASKALKADAELTPMREDEAVASRFIQLFESHGVHRNQIPEFFDYGLTLADLQSEERLIEKLTPEILRKAAELFLVNSEWLSHGKAEIFPQHHFYKYPDKFGKYIDELLSPDSSKDIEGYVLTIKPPYKQDYDTLILLKEEIGLIGERTIYRYHYCSGWRITYWKCCADIACCIAQAQQRNIYFAGKTVDASWIESFSDGMRLPNYDFEMAEIVFPHSGYWNAGEFVDIPEQFIKPLNKKDGYSVVSAISRWLEYHKKGFIYVCSDTVNERVKAAFERYLKSKSSK